MHRGHYKILSFFFLAGLFVLNGCATAPRRADRNAELSTQVADLQAQLQEKDQQIQELEAQLQSYQRAIQTPANFSRDAASGGSSIIKVAGVSALDLQKALVRAGFDPGPVDGRVGKKTKAAVRAFQSAHHLTTDGIVGEKTWDLLKS